MSRVASKVEQLRAGEAVCDVDSAPGEAIEAFGVIGLDLNMDLANRWPWSPIAIEGAEMEPTSTIPPIEAVGSAAGADVIRVGQPVGRKRQQTEQFAVRLGKPQAQRPVIQHLHASKGIARRVGAEWGEEDRVRAVGLRGKRAAPRGGGILCPPGRPRLVPCRTQVKGVGLSRVADLPSFGESGDRVLAGIETRQSLEDLATDGK